jgi:predicted HAD superfamily Cof-like phosphohydrolase
VNVLQSSVREFHEAFGHVVNDEPVREVPDEVRELRLTLHREELEELLDAARDHDVAALTKEACDLLYVATGTLVSLGVDLDRAFAEVHRSNMAKVWPDGNVRTREDGKTLKPPTYTPPDMEAAIYR